MCRFLDGYASPSKFGEEFLRFNGLFLRCCPTRADISLGHHLSDDRGRKGRCAHHRRDIVRFVLTVNDIHSKPLSAVADDIEAHRDDQGFCFESTVLIASAQR